MGNCCFIKVFLYLGKEGIGVLVTEAAFYPPHQVHMYWLWLSTEMDATCCHFSSVTTRRPKEVWHLVNSAVCDLSVSMGRADLLFFSGLLLTFSPNLLQKVMGHLIWLPVVSSKICKSIVTSLTHLCYVSSSGSSCTVAPSQERCDIMRPWSEVFLLKIFWSDQWAGRIHSMSE